MKQPEEQRMCVKVCCKLGKNFTETFQLLNKAYGKDCMSRTQCYEWFKHFKEGRMLVSEDPKPGHPSTSTNDDHVKSVCAVIHGNRHLTVQEVADEVGISIGSLQQMLCAGRVLNCGKTRLGCCTTTMHRLKRCFSSALIWQNSDIHCAPSTLFSRLSPSRIFPVSQT